MPYGYWRITLILTDPKSARRRSFADDSAGGLRSALLAITGTAIIRAPSHETDSGQKSR
jgi:hypothetical protein